MKNLLLLSDNTEFREYLEERLSGYELNIHMAEQASEVNHILRTVKPDVVIVGLDENDIANYDELVDNVRKTQDQRKLSFIDSAKRGIEEVFYQAVVGQLLEGPLSSVSEVGQSAFEVDQGQVRLKTNRDRQELTNKSEATNNAIVAAKEALAGIASHQDDPDTIGNKAVVPIDRDMLDVIDNALDASLTISNPSLILRNGAKTTLQSLAEFLDDARKVIEQVEKTATASIKTIGVLGVLAAALVTVVNKITELVSAISLPF